MEVIFNRDVNPVHTGVYIVDRGEKLGTPYRFYNAETGAWSRCEYTLEDVVAAKDSSTGLGFLPWRGPFKVSKRQPVAEVALANTMTTEVVDQFGTVAKIPAVAKTVKVEKVKAPKVVKVAKAKTDKVTYPDGTIVFRADRNKFMAWFGGKAEGARPTVEAAQAFLTKKYNVTVFNIIK
jgi:hypothetical protein